MWLLTLDPLDYKLALVEFVGDEVEPYAILSHTWEDGEILYSDIRQGNFAGKKGVRKIEYAFSQAAMDGYKYLWIDTCCINKDSSAELSEAINSMYSLYRNAAKCYAYVADVSLSSFWTDFPQARWWKRGWTLQELLAPEHVCFYSGAWELLGTKIELKTVISNITSIDEEFLDGSRDVQDASIAKRMSWVASRETKRPEDIAYCLMGIFSVNMPMLYGEGSKKAFMRLQEEIMRYSDDSSLFAWIDSDYAGAESYHGLLADSPKAFKLSSSVEPYSSIEGGNPWTVTNFGLRINLGLYEEEEYIAASLMCPPPGQEGGFAGIYLAKLQSGDNQYARVRCGEICHIKKRGNVREIYVRQMIPGARRSQKSVPIHGLQLRSMTSPRQPYTILSSRCFRNNGHRGYRIYFSSTPSRGEPWVEKGVPTYFEFPTTPNSPVVALSVRDAHRHGGFVLVLGSLGNSAVGSDLFPDSALTDISRIQQNYRPKPMGTLMKLEHVSIRVMGNAQVDDQYNMIFYVDVRIQ